MTEDLIEVYKTSGERLGFEEYLNTFDKLKAIKKR